MLFGDYNPSAKLPITMYPVEYLCPHSDATKCAADSLPLTQMSVTAPPGRTHLYYSGTWQTVEASGGWVCVRVDMDACRHGLRLDMPVDK